MCDGKGRGTCVPVKGRLSSNDATARNMNFSSYTNFVNPSRGFRASSNFQGGASRCALDR